MDTHVHVYYTYPSICTCMKIYHKCAWEYSLSSVCSCCLRMELFIIHSICTHHAHRGFLQDVVVHVVCSHPIRWPLIGFVTGFAHFSLVCLFSCFEQPPDCEKLFSQYLHLEGFSPVCVVSCFFTLLGSLKHLSQYWHLKGFSPVCVLSWLFTLLA